MIKISSQTNLSIISNKVSKKATFDIKGRGSDLMSLDGLGWINGREYTDY